MRSILVLFLTLATALSLFAQTAVLRGRVTDESGAIVPGATVTMTGPAGVRSSTVDATGAYTFSGVAPGDYTVQAAAPNLSQTPVPVSLRAGSRTLNLVLRVAAREEKVTVQDNSGPTVSTDAASNASALVLRGADLDALSDDPDDLAADLQALAGPSAGPSGGTIFVDGFSGGELPPKSSIREIRINQNPFAPEYDKLGYGKIEIFTKPGSEKYHGTADYNFAHDFWNSRNPYAPEKAPFLLDEFEGDAGGPLGKRASFTVDAQRNMVDNGSIYDVITVAPQTFALTPLAGAFTAPGRYTKVSPRVDYQLTPKHTLMFRYGITHSDVRDNGIGAQDLISTGYHSQFTNQTVQAADTAVYGATINETRFQYYRTANQWIANNPDAELQVLGAFIGGGSPYGRTFDTQNSYEFQNYTSMLRGTHSVRFGVRLRGQTDDSTSPQNFNGTFTFGSITAYQQTLLLQSQGYSPAQIRALGFGATQFSLNAGIADAAVHQVDVGLFAGDEWKLRPNLTFSYGLRYEAQSNISDHGDFAPRLALAWAPGGTGSKTVLRAGFGMFYDRFPLADVLIAARFNGLVQQQYVVTNPDFFPTIPSLASLSGLQSSQVIEKLSSTLRAPYIMQSAFTVERQLPNHTTLAVTYTNSHGMHLLRSQDINAPLPGTYNPAAAASGAFPLGQPNPVFLMESSGIYNQNQLIANVNTKVNAAVSLFGFYVLNRALSNTDGVNTSPANPYSFAGEYGPAATDVRNRVTAGGSISLRWNIRISPYVILQSGMPFDITTGSDLYGTTLFNARPGIATDPNKPGLVQTAYGLLDPHPGPGEALVPRNYGRGPGQFTVNLRLAKTIGFGGERGGAAVQSAPPLHPPGWPYRRSPVAASATFSARLPPATGSISRSASRSATS